MAIWRAQVEFQGASELPEDRMVNTWHFEGGTGATDYANIYDMLTDFYTETYAGSEVTATYPTIAFTGDVDIKLYCLADPLPRVPRDVGFFSFTPTSSEGLPQEVALCLSYAAAPASGIPAARRRGRVYLGPFAEASNTDARPGTALITVIAAAASELKAAADASVTWQWIVYSRADEAGYPVVSGWLDNAWDTQRRRGWSPTSRTTWS